ncbi:hypothetical protein CDO26_22090 (plasmid) [Sinorhizobium meliloti]|nr:hypothetical protein CDO26_22090 [Sinorhizobium meliloti]
MKPAHRTEFLTVPLLALVRTSTRFTQSGRHKDFPAFGFLAKQIFASSRLLPLTLRPTVRTAFRRAFGTIIATTKEE